MSCQQIYKLSNLHTITQKDLTEGKIFKKVLEGILFLKHPVYVDESDALIGYIILWVPGCSCPTTTCI